MTDLILNNYYVAFIDLLGFSHMVKHDCETHKGNQKYFSKLYEVHKKSQSLKDGLEGLQVTQFSDSIVLSLPYCKENFESFIDVIATHQFELLKNGILCRGGVSYGMQFSEEAFLFSNGLIDAYRIESEVANFPRIVVSNELISLLFPRGDEGLNGKIIKENDECRFVNYLLGDSPDENWHLLSKVVPEDLSDNSSIRSKQIWLIDYYNHSFSDSVKRSVERFS